MAPAKYIDRYREELGDYLKSLNPEEIKEILGFSIVANAVDKEIFSQSIEEIPVVSRRTKQLKSVTIETTRAEYPITFTKLDPSKSTTLAEVFEDGYSFLDISRDTQQYITDKLRQGLSAAYKSSVGGPLCLETIIEGLHRELIGNVVRNQHVIAFDDLEKGSQLQELFTETAEAIQRYMIGINLPMCTFPGIVKFK